MAYTPTTWVNDVTPVNAANMNKIEAQLVALDSGAGGGGATDLSYEGAHVPASAHQDGDIVVLNGITYVCVRDTNAAPDPTQWAALGLTLPVYNPPPAYGTTLPASPTDGMEAILVDSLTNPTYQWRFRFNAGSASAYKWEFIGGADVLLIVGALETVGSASAWVDLATPGPLFVAPRAGDYNAMGVAQLGTGVAAYLSQIGLSIGATGPGFATAATIVAASQYEMATVNYRMLGVGAGSDIRMRYNGQGTSASFANRQLRIQPVRVA